MAEGPSSSGSSAGRPDVITDDAQILQAERTLLDDDGERAKRRGVKNPLWSGIGLSGGGVRSASFCLGVMQSLAGANLLSKFDYMSSVSGGSFIAASLQWYWSKKGPDGPVYDAGANFPYGNADPDSAAAPESAPLTFLRDNASYLTAGRGINVWSGIAVVLRTAIISCAVWIPLLVSINLIALLVHALIFGEPTPDGRSWNVFYALLLAVSAFGSGLAVISALAFGLLSFIRPDIAFSPRYRGRAWLSAVAALVMLLATVAFAMVAGQTLSVRFDAGLTFLLLALGILSATWLVGSVALIRGVSARQNAGYWLRRLQERWAGVILVVVVGTFVVGIVPDVARVVQANLPSEESKASVAGTISVLLTLGAGIASSVYAFYTLVQNVRPGLLGRYLPQIGAAVFLYGTLVGSYIAAEGLIFLLSGVSPSRATLAAIFLVLGALGLVILVVANVNQIGLHRFYRDRLLEAFMPDSAEPEGAASAAPFADRFTISRVWGRRDCPYPIINTNVILSQDGEGKPERRGGDSFIFSPMFVGSDTTGWLDTDVYAKRRGPVTLASAMAVSGAAINSNAGYIGGGPTRNPLVAAAMTFLNVRLGLWLRNPRRNGGRFGFYAPTYLWPTLGILLGKGHRPNDRFIEVSDGGHFDNLGLYELIRRKLDLILIVDGEGDAAVSLPAFVSIVRRVREDFGARILVEADGSGPERLLPVTAAGAGYPVEARFAKSSFFTCQIRYADGTKGLLIYLKATLLADSYFTTRGYRARNPDFPHQTTADQFFDPVQFESYRELGYVCAKHMISQTGLDTLFEEKHALKTRIASLTPTP